MSDRARGLWRRLSQNLGAIPGLVVLVFALLAVGFLQLDHHLDLDDTTWVFAGDGPAARTVLSVIAGSLITVAGLTFSITMVVLQLASSQFSPRVLRGFFGDRVTQLTIGTFIGTFVFAMLVLRSVGSVAEPAFVPRLSVTVASLMGVGATVLLIVYLHHVSQLIQVSQVAATVAREALARIDRLFPEGGGEPARPATRPDATTGSTLVRPDRPGYVQRIEADLLLDRLEGVADHVAVLVRPGDFVSVESPIAEVWPADAADRCGDEITGAIRVAGERDIDQDIAFGLRQLGDIALKALSPGINDPSTAVTCIGYMRAILVRITGRGDPPGVRRAEGGSVQLHLAVRSYEEHLEHLVQIGRYVDGDAWVAGALLEALASCSRTAADRGDDDRVTVIRSVAAAIAEQAIAQARTTRDRERLTELVGQV